MPSPPQSAAFDRHFARDLWHLTRVYWSSADAKKAALLLALCVALELGTVYGNVRLAGAQARVFDAVQNKEAGAFLTAIEWFLAIALAVVLVSTYRIYARGILQMRWRQHLTDHFLRQWMGPQAYCQRELFHKETDNPDQRIAEDIQSYVASALGLSLSLLSAVATLVSFAGILWTLSGKWPLRLGTHEFWIPGLMMWVAIGYALLSTWLTHRVGRSLVSINFNRLRYEADFRYGLVRFRDNVEAVGLLRGNAVERQGALARFGNVILNWWQLIAAQRNLSLLTSGIGQANGVVPLLVAAPAFFAGRMTLGALTETGIAYGQVSGSLAWFVNAYQEIAQWRASIERLARFQDVVDATRTELLHGDGIRIEPSADAALHFVDVGLAQADGRLIADGLNATVPAGARLALLGPPGAVKTALFRAIAGIWPFGQGRIELPAAARPLFVPHQPYLSIGTLRQIVSYPSPAGAFGDGKIAAALGLLDLDHLQTRLDDAEPWEQLLSSDEQQRLMFVRVLLHEPDWIFMDDATATLDGAMERRIYTTLAARLPHATVLSITNRPDVAELQEHRWTIAINGAGRMALEAA
ncbi:MAG: ABC transporter ATP-binding protein/permease [Candidatus Binatia bacterium]